MAKAAIPDAKVQSLLTVESDKASMEIPSAAAGVVKELKVQLGDKVREGSLLLLLESDGATAGATDLAAPPAPGAEPAPVPAAGAASPAAAPPPHAPATAPTHTPATAPAHTPATAPAHAPAPAPTSTPDAVVAGLPHASPSIRRLAREFGVPLAEVKGSGPKGRITQEDVQGFVKAVMAGGAQTAAQSSALKAAAAAPATGGLLPGSARSSARSCRASRRSAAPTCTATGC